MSDLSVDTHISAEQNHSSERFHGVADKLLESARENDPWRKTVGNYIDISHSGKVVRRDDVNLPKLELINGSQFLDLQNSTRSFPERGAGDISSNLDSRSHGKNKGSEFTTYSLDNSAIKEPKALLSDKLLNRQEEKDAEEFDKRFGRNPNSPEAVAWLQQRILKQADDEAHEAISQDQNGNGLTHPRACGLRYGQTLLLSISARNHNFNAGNVSWSYFQYGATFLAGWQDMRGFHRVKS